MHLYGVSSYMHEMTLCKNNVADFSLILVGKVKDMRISC